VTGDAYKLLEARSKEQQALAHQRELASLLFVPNYHPAVLESNDSDGAPAADAAVSLDEQVSKEDEYGSSSRDR